MRDAQRADGHAQLRPLYPLSPIQLNEVDEVYDEMIHSYGRWFGRGPDGHWHLVEAEAGD